MKRILLALAMFASACASITPKPPTPPAPTTFVVRLTVLDQATGQWPQGGATGYTDAQDDPNRKEIWVGEQGARWDDFTHAGWNICAKRDGWTTACAPVADAVDQEVVLTIAAVAPPEVPLAPRDRLKNVRACLMNDFDGSTPVWGSSLPGLFRTDHDRFVRWLQTEKACGATHVVTGAFDGPAGPAYPGMFDNPDWRQRPDEVRAMFEEIRHTASADGFGFRIIYMMSGGALPRQLVDDEWPKFTSALADMVDQVIFTPCWECVQGDATAAQLNYANGRLKQYLPNMVLANHFSPGRAVGLGNPTEPDSPYRRWALAQCDANGQPVRNKNGDVLYDLQRNVGDAAEQDKAATPTYCGLPGRWDVFEPDFWTLNNGPKVDLLFYQTDHGMGNYRDCNEDEEDGSCWLNRWQDVVSRVGAGFKGWAIRTVVFFESCAYERFRNLVDAQGCTDMATRAKRVADKWHVTIGFGNGLPAQ